MAESTGNPLYDNMQEPTVPVQDPKRKLDAQSQTQDNESFERDYILDAVIKTVSEDNTDEYTVDVFEGGYITDGSDSDPSREDVPAFATNAADWFDVGDLVRVKISPTDNKAWLIHDTQPQLGIVVCNGPNGEPPPSNNTYWVALARIWNASKVMPNDIAAFSGGSAFSRIVLAENLFERQCLTHLVRPGAVVVLEWNWDLEGTGGDSESPAPGFDATAGVDQGTNAPRPNRRYFFQAADEGTCVPPCGSSSSSSGCPGYCWYKWTVKYACPNPNDPVGGFQEPVIDNWLGCPTANPFNGNPYNEWFYEGSEFDVNGFRRCIFSYVVRAEHCCTPGTCPETVVYPGNPPNPARCCGKKCVTTHTVEYDCPSEEFQLRQSVVECTDDVPPPDQRDVWILKNRDYGICRYERKHVVETPCVNDDDCTPEAYPEDPDPTGCCRSSSSSSSAAPNKCIVTFKVFYDCETKTFTPWTETPECSSEPIDPDTLNKWIFTGRTHAGPLRCQYQYRMETGQACKSKFECEIPDYPGDPHPSQCCDSSSSGASSSSSSGVSPCHNPVIDADIKLTTTGNNITAKLTLHMCDGTTRVKTSTVGTCCPPKSSSSSGSAGGSLLYEYMECEEVGGSLMYGSNLIPDVFKYDGSCWFATGETTVGAPFTIVPEATFPGTFQCSVCAATL